MLHVTSWDMAGVRTDVTCYVKILCVGRVKMLHVTLRSLCWQSKDVTCYVMGYVNNSTLVPGYNAVRCSSVNVVSLKPTTCGGKRSLLYLAMIGSWAKQVGVSRNTVDMHEYVHDTVSYRAVPFDTPHARSCFKFWAREREQRKQSMHATSTAKEFEIVVHSSPVRWTQGRRSPCHLCGNRVGRSIMLYRNGPTSNYANYTANWWC